MQDQISSMTSEMQSKIEFLENKLSREEKNKQELQAKLVVNEQNQKEILFFIRNQ